MGGKNKQLAAKGTSPAKKVKSPASINNRPSQAQPNVSSTSPMSVDNAVPSSTQSHSPPLSPTSTRRDSAIATGETGNTMASPRDEINEIPDKTSPLPVQKHENNHSLGKINQSVEEIDPIGDSPKVPFMSQADHLKLATHTSSLDDEQGLHVSQHANILKKSPIRTSPVDVAKATQSGNIQHTFKIIVIGSESCGKTSLLRKFASNTFASQYLPTIGIDFLTSTFVCPVQNNAMIKLHIWDSSGSARFSSLIPNYLRDSHVCLICFDLTSVTSYDSVFNTYLPTLKQSYGDNVIIIVVGCKNDLSKQRQVSFKDVKQRTKQLSIPYIETSAKCGTNINLLFSQIALILPEIESEQTQAMNPTAQKHLDTTEEAQGGDTTTPEDVPVAHSMVQQCFGWLSFRCWPSSATNEPQQQPPPPSSVDAVIKPSDILTDADIATDLDF